MASNTAPPTNLSRRQATILYKRKAQEEEEARIQAQHAKEQEEYEQSIAKKVKREPPPNWSEPEKDIFFQGLLAVGRDFDKLHKYCVETKTKLKDTGDYHERTKDQIRHLYYRSIKNLQSTVDIKLSSNKEANELFLILNYAEFRRRVGHKQANHFMQKYPKKFSQLIQTGENKLKLKGKLVRIKTPHCAPLKALFDKVKEKNEKPEKSEKSSSRRKPASKSAKVPDVITLDLQPRTNTAWQRITDIQHNPHLRLKLKSHQTIALLLEILEKKWIPASSRFRRELGLDTDFNTLPHIKLYPEKSAKLKTFQLSQVNPKPQINTIISLAEYLKLIGEDGEEKDEKEAEPTSNDELSLSGDPAQFLKDKLDGITEKIQQTATSSTSPNTPTPSTEAEIRKQTDDEVDDSTSLSQSLITQSTNGWMSDNSKELLVSYLYLLHGNPDKLVLEYEFPDLEGSDDVLHLFTGVINRLVTVADVEFSNQQNKKHKQTLSGSPSTNCSPSSRLGKRNASPSTSTVKSPSTRLVNIQPAPSDNHDKPNGSLEFKRPASPNADPKLLADAIFNKRHQLKALRRTTKPVLVQKNILPAPIRLKLGGPPSIQPKPTNHISVLNKLTSQIPVTIKSLNQTTRLDISHISSAAVLKADFIPTTIGNHTNQTTLEQSSSSSLEGTTLHLPEQQHEPERNANPSDILEAAMSALVDTPVKSTQPTNTNTSYTDTDSMVSTCQIDMNSFSIDALNSDKPRRIKPIMISDQLSLGNHEPTESDFTARAVTITAQNEDSVSKLLNKPHISEITSDHSLSLGSFLNGLSQTHIMDAHLSGVDKDSRSGLMDSFPSFLQSDQNHSNNVKLSNSKDTWLTSDVSMTDFSLSSFLAGTTGGYKTTEQSVVNNTDSVVLPSDDTRMSFLNKLDDLGLDSNLDMLPTSSDDCPKFDNLSALETPQKQS